MNQLLMIVLIMLIPVALTIMWMNAAHKRDRKQRQQQHTRYLNQVLEETGINVTFQKQLIYQTVILDEVARKLLVIYVNGSEWYNMFNIAKLKSFNIVKEPVGFSSANHKNAEAYPTKIALEVVSLENEGSDQIVFYDHIQQNMYVLPEMEREAQRLQERIMQIKNRLTAVS